MHCSGRPPGATARPRSPTAAIPSTTSSQTRRPGTRQDRASISSAGSGTSSRPAARRANRPTPRSHPAATTATSGPPGKSGAAMSTEMEPYAPFALGRESVAWRIHASPGTLLGGIRALMLMALHPAAMAGVADHSRYRDDVWGRLNRTRDFVLTMVYGDVWAAAASAAHVRGIHTRVVGFDHVTGLPYHANDADLLLWVHCVLVESFLVAYQTYGRPLSAQEADRYVAERMRQGVLLGLPPEEIPHDFDELERRLRGYDELLCLTPA